MTEPTTAGRFCSTQLGIILCTVLLLVWDDSMAKSAVHTTKRYDYRQEQMHKNYQKTKHKLPHSGLSHNPPPLPPSKNNHQLFPRNPDGTFSLNPPPLTPSMNNIQFFYRNPDGTFTLDKPKPTPNENPLNTKPNTYNALPTNQNLNNGNTLNPTSNTIQSLPVEIFPNCDYYMHFKDLTFVPKNCRFQYTLRHLPQVIPSK